MDAQVISQLILLNHQFYQTLGEPFAATRQRLQPGVSRVLSTLPNPANILDVGCGNGELASELIRRGQRGKYIGLDASGVLLDIARQSVASISPEDISLDVAFIQMDLTGVGWERELSTSAFDVILAFAVLHHLPGAELRVQVLRNITRLLAKNGQFIHSEWQFLNSSRLRMRIQPWEVIGLRAEQVDEGDYLLDWRRGGYHLRYVHHFTQLELGQLAHECGFEVVETFESDGENGRLGLYQVWKHRQG